MARLQVFSSEGGLRKSTLPPRDKDEQWVELLTSDSEHSRRPSKGASPPEHRGMKAKGLVLFNWLLLAVALAQGLRISETEGGLCHGGSKSCDKRLSHSSAPCSLPRSSCCTWVRRCDEEAHLEHPFSAGQAQSSEAPLAPHVQSSTSEKEQELILGSFPLRPWSATLPPTHPPGRAGWLRVKGRSRSRTSEARGPLVPISARGQHEQD